jgi:hypothetical protein
MGLLKKMQELHHYSFAECVHEDDVLAEIFDQMEPNMKYTREIWVKEHKLHEPDNCATCISAEYQDLPEGAQEGDLLCMKMVGQNIPEKDALIRFKDGPFICSKHMDLSE